MVCKAFEWVNSLLDVLSNIKPVYEQNREGIKLAEAE